MEVVDMAVSGSVQVRTELKRVTYLFGSPAVLANVLAVLEPSHNLLNGGFLFLPLPHLQRLSSLPRLLLLILEGLLDELNVFQAQLFAYDVEIACGVDVAFDVDDLSIVESTNDLEDGIDGTDM